MGIKTTVSLTFYGARVAMLSLAALQLSVFPVMAATTQAFASPDARTASPIKHVIVIIGENRSFDHVFATYVPKRGQTVHNLLSEGIIKLDADKNAVPGPNFRKAQQLSASDLGGQDTFLLSPGAGSPPVVVYSAARLLAAITLTTFPNSAIATSATTRVW